MGEKKGKKEKSEEQNGIIVVLKTEMHCEGCANKILKCVKTIEGVEKAKAEGKANKLTVRGEVDPSELREELQERLKKKVELISPQLPKKDKDGNNKGDNKKSDGKDNNNKSSKDSKKSDDKKPKEKEAPVVTAVLKLRLHCMGCVDQIHKIASKTKGVESITIDREKELLTVTGTMDVKALADSLAEKMKRPVEIVPPRKDKDGGGGGEGNNNGSGGGGGKKSKKKNGGGDDAGDEAETDGGMFEGNMMKSMGPPVPSYGPIYGPAAGYGPAHGYPSLYPYNLHAPQLFSDENPNACTVL